ncbi:Rieske (2Fe-2S) protein [Streptomyces sp. P38-E01]|uniref:Cytochrome bc1 complex Rieske iron-sulfur subunit n=1 Tax=Streptomyces tardus TaxID=2780544 RepID=A0A949JIK5_9ACTN|nr:Rieske (2Fe-2S) protein [Streptomyces tardus]MBU7600117.1 Rieske (2Fe-2S) protein [Streptomyces tardus]
MSAARASRRTVLTAAGAAGLTTALAACGGSEDKGADGSSDSEDRSAEGKESPGGGEEGGDGKELARTDDIQPGEGKVFREEKVVVVQPTEGEFKAYSAECTHKGCLVSSVKDGSINCACHQSAFSVADGSVTGGPAREPLPEARINVEGGSIRLG